MIRGHLLVIPIDKAFLYVEPVYLRAQDYEIPQLQRIIVSDGARAAMEPTLHGALEAVFGRGPASEVSGGEPTAIRPPAELQAARDALEAVEGALRQGDWTAFGRAMQRLTDILGRPRAPGDGS